MVDVTRKDGVESRLVPFSKMALADGWYMLLVYAWNNVS